MEVYAYLIIVTMELTVVIAVIGLGFNRMEHLIGSRQAYIDLKKAHRQLHNEFLASQRENEKLRRDLRMLQTAQLGNGVSHEHE